MHNKLCCCACAARLFHRQQTQRVVPPHPVPGSTAPSKLLNCCPNSLTHAQASDSADAATVRQPQAPGKASKSSGGSRSSVADVEDGPSASSSAAAGPNSTTQQRQGSSTSSSTSSNFLQDNPGLLRRVLDSSSAADAYELLAQHHQQQQGGQAQQQHHAVPLSAADVDSLLRCCLEAGNVTLALSVYQQLKTAKRAAVGSSSSTVASPWWPAATPQHTETLILGLCKQLRVADALAALDSIRSHGVPGSDEVRVRGTRHGQLKQVNCHMSSAVQF